MAGKDINNLQHLVESQIAEISKGARIADDVADQLRARRIKGVQGDTCSCPIANLIRTVPGVTEVDVYGGRALVWDAHDDFVVTLPEVVVGFAYLFDQGVYLDLVEVTS